MTRDARRGERRLSHGSLHQRQVLLEPGHSFTSPKSWTSRDWQSPLNWASSVCAKPIKLGSTTLGILCIDGSCPSHIPTLGARLHDLINSKENLPHTVIIKAQRLNGADITWPKELIHVTESPQDGPSPEEVQDVPEQMQFLEDQWYHEDSKNGWSLGQQKCVGVAFACAQLCADRQTVTSGASKTSVLSWSHFVWFASTNQGLSQ